MAKNRPTLPDAADATAEIDKLLIGNREAVESAAAALSAWIELETYPESEGA